MQLCTATVTERADVPTRFATAEAAEHAFYDALERADLSMLLQVWAEDEDIICVHPGGLRLVGHHAVKESWQEILSNGGLPIRHARKTIAAHSARCCIQGAMGKLIVVRRLGWDGVQRQERVWPLCVAAGPPPCPMPKLYAPAYPAAPRNSAASYTEWATGWRRQVCVWLRMPEPTRTQSIENYELRCIVGVYQRHHQSAS